MYGTVHRESDYTMEIMIVSLAILLSSFFGAVPVSAQDDVSYNKQDLISPVIRKLSIPQQTI
jgi:hypothetical protein